MLKGQSRFDLYHKTSYRMDMEYRMTLSTMGHTWIIDLDGTIVKHNGYKIDGVDTMLEGATEFLQRIPLKDMIIILTSRAEQYREMTESFLHENKIRYDYIIFNAPFGERILLNDNKSSGLKTSIGISTFRDQWINLVVTEDESI